MRYLFGLVILLSIAMVGFAGSEVAPTDGLTPAPFSFTPICGQSPGVLVVSDSITVSGITDPAPISVNNGEYSINGGPYTTKPGTIDYGQSVTVRHTTAQNDDTLVSTFLTVGGASATFTSSTGPCLRGTR